MPRIISFGLESGHMVVVGKSKSYDRRSKRDVQHVPLGAVLLSESGISPVAARTRHGSSACCV